MGKKRKYKRLSLDPQSTTLVIIDMENDFCKPGGKLYHPDGVDEVIPQCKKLLKNVALNLEKCRLCRDPCYLRPVRA